MFSCFLLHDNMAKMRTTRPHSQTSNNLNHRMGRTGELKRTGDLKIVS